MLSAREYARLVTTLCEAEDESEALRAALDALGAPRARWTLYRRMVRRRFERVLREAYPRLARLQGDAFSASVAAFLAGGAPRRGRLAQLSADFAAWRAPTLSGLPAEVLRYESALAALRDDERPMPSRRPIDFGAPAQVNPVRVALTLASPVWELPSAAPPAGEANAEPLRTGHDGAVARLETAPPPLVAPPPADDALPARWVLLHRHPDTHRVHRNVPASDEERAWLGALLGGATFHDAGLAGGEATPERLGRYTQALGTWIERGLLLHAL